MPDFAAVIFDLDGTLVDSLADLAHAANHVLEGYGLPTHPLPAYRQFVGDGARVLLERALGPDHQNQLDAAEEAFRAYYVEHMEERTVAYEGIRELLAALGQAGLPLGVLSNKPHPATQALVGRMFPGVFGVVEGHRPERPRKPAPDGALDAARALGAEPADCAFVGDTNVDVRTGVAAGMFTVGVLWGFRSREELEGAGAAEVVERPAQLGRLLLPRS